MHKLGFVFSLIALGVVAIGFLRIGGADAVNSVLNKGNAQEIDSTPTPMDEVNKVPQINSDFPPVVIGLPGGPIGGKFPKEFFPTRETIPKRETNPTIQNDEIVILSNVFPVPIAIPKPAPKVITKSVPSQKVQSSINDNNFKGGGESFIGGTVRETPITKNSTLSFIIDKLGVSASKAASIRTDLRGGLDNFDLGTNTGSGQKGNTEDATKSSLDERLRKAAEEAKLIFDSGSISNF